jgi:hypothetical protein
VVDVELAELVEGGVVVLDGGVRRLEVELGHRFAFPGMGTRKFSIVAEGFGVAE